MGVDAVLTYLGDDLTDEDAFNALHGRGLSVLVRGSQRKTAADLWIKPPQELLQFLEKWIKCGG
jgi:trehalose-phosphatase